MSRRSRRKGHRWERAVARRLAEATGREVARNLNEVRDGRSGDLDTGDLPLAVECRCGARPSVWKAVRDAEEGADGTGQLVVAIVRRSGSGSRPPEDLAVLPLEDFEKLLGVAVGSGAW